MEISETPEEFYRRKFCWIPENLRNDIGHFNVFRLEPFVGDKAEPVPYERRDFFKIMLVKGNGRVHYADKQENIKSHPPLLTDDF